MNIPYEYYTEEFRHGYNIPITTPEEFAFLVSRSWQKIKAYNGKYKYEKAEFDFQNSPEYLINCICAVAEIEQQLENNPKAGEITSASNDGVSWSKKTADVGAADLQNEINGIIEDYLVGTDLHDMFISRLIANG